MVRFYAFLACIIMFAGIVCGFMVPLTVDAAVEIPVVSEILRGSADAIGNAWILVWGASLLVSMLSFWTGFCASIFNQQ